VAIVTALLTWYWGMTYNHWMLLLYFHIRQT
jgi:hypothetical protein